MLVGKDGQVWDGDLDLARELVSVIDRHLAALESEWRDTPEADQFGLFDRMEHLTGLGFVACQTYMASTYGSLGMAKGDALAKGPRHRSGTTVAEIVNHSANYWKHRDEWKLDRSARGQQRISEAFESVGFPVGTDYPLAGILTDITTPHEPSLSQVLRLLVDWRDQLRSGAVQDTKAP